MRIVAFVIATLWLPALAHAADLPAEPTSTRADIEVPGRRPLLQRGRLDATAPVVALSGAELRERHTSLGEALDQQPGMDTKQLSGFGAPSLLSVRGAAADQVAVFVDGVPLQAVDGGAVDLADLPLGQIERAEVYRGVTPALLGGQAIGGALHLTLRKLPGQAEASTSLGSYGARAAEASLGGELGSWQGSAGLRWLGATGDYPYRSDNGTAWDPADDAWRKRQNNDLQRWGGTAALQGRLGPRWTLDGRWLGSHLEQGVPGRALYEAEDARLSTDRHLGVLALSGHGLWDDGDRLRLYVLGSRHAAEVDDRLGELGLPWHQRQVLAGWGLQSTYESSDKRRLGLVLRLAGQMGEAQGTDLRAGAQLPGSNRQVASAGLGLPVRLLDRKLEIAPTLTVEVLQSRLYAADRAPFTWQPVRTGAQVLPTARLGVAGRLGPVLATASASRSVRAPSLVELFGNSASIRGNPRLEPETALGADLGLQASGRHERWEAAAEAVAFVQQVDDLIQLQTLGPHLARYANLAGADLQGLELSGVLDWGRQVRLTGQHSTLVTRNNSPQLVYAGKVLPLRPRTRWSLRLDGQRRLGPVRTALWTSLHWQAGHFLDEANLAALPARTLWATGLRLEHPGSGVWLDLRVDDLLNTQPTDLIGYPLPGRTVLAQVGWRGSIEPSP